MRFDFADLRLFLAVVEAGSITHGAAAANLSLAAASERLRDMEARGGVRLLDRGRRGVAVTRAGEALAHHARLVLRQMAAMQSELSEHARRIRGSVRLIGNSAAVTEFLPGRLGPWLAAHPRIDIDLAERPSADIVKAVAGGLADVGIVSDAVDSGALVTSPFAVDRLVAVMARGHPLAGRKIVGLSQVVAEDQLGFDGALQRLLDEHAARAGHRLRPRVVLRTFDGVCRLAADGAGIGIVPETAARRCRRSLPLAFVRLAEPWATRRLLLCRSPAADLDPYVRALVDHLSSGEAACRSPAGDRRERNGKGVKTTVGYWIGKCK